MKMMRKYTFLILGFLLILNSCKTGEIAKTQETGEAELVIAEVKQEFAPDKRVALFNIETSRENGNVILTGESNLPEAVADLKERLKAEEISFIDQIKILPSEEMNGKTSGVIKISVANLRSEPSHSAELVTQAILGTPVKVLKKDGSWFYIQTPEGYLAWTDYGGVTPITPKELESWRASDKVIYLKTFGLSYEEANVESQPVSDLVAGNILELLGQENGFYKLKYPNGKIAFVEEASAQPYQEWVSSLEQTGESLVETSKSLMGLPYLWGGTSAKGVDCSGFTKTIYFLNGIILPRDASQQIHAGIAVDTSKNFENLKPGDLLFFGRKATDSTGERVIHVGMWIGDNKFIHSMGDVHISTFDKSNPDFDEYNYNRYLRTKRMLNQDDEKLIQLSKNELFMDNS